MRHAKGFPMRAAVLVVISLLILTSCTTTATVAINEIGVVCQGFQPLSWSLSDTPRTIAAIKTHNAMWHALCNDGGLERA